MAVPKRKSSKARKNKRRSNVWKLEAPAMCRCTQCGIILSFIEKARLIGRGFGGERHGGGIAVRTQRFRQVIYECGKCIPVLRLDIFKIHIHPGKVFGLYRT